MEEDAAEGTVACRAPHPTERGRAQDHLHLCPGFAREDTRFERTLSAADDDDVPAAEIAEVGMVAGMACESGRKAIELGRPPRE